MTEGFVLGVDLGTSHTVAMLRRPDGRTRPLLFDGRPLLPSAVYLDTTGRMHVGPDALRLGHADPARLEPHPKRHVDEGRVLLGDAEPPVADLLAAILSAVAREAVATAGFLPAAVLTYPASWGAPRREVLFEALGKAGWPRETRLLPEPVAAASYFADVLRRPVPAGSALAVFDFGGGTLDVAVARNEGPGPDGRPRFTVLASGGDDNLGGLDLDAALVDHLGKGLSGGEPQAWRALTTPSTLAQWRARRDFWDTVRGAKEMLSRSSFAPIPVPGVEQAVHLTREELEAAADPLIRRAVAEAHSVIVAAGLAPADLAGLFLVGGSSRVPMAARLLHSHLGVAPTVIEQPEFPVAEGATLAAPVGPVGSVGSAGPVKTFASGSATAATPTPTPRTLPQVPPPITDTRADSAPITPTMPPENTDGPPESLGWPPQSPSGSPGKLGRTPVSGSAQALGGAPGSGSAAGPASLQRGAGDDDRVYVEPVDPWATGEAAAIAAGGHGLYPGSSTSFSGSPTSSPGAPGAPGHQPGSPAAGGGDPSGDSHGGDSHGGDSHGGDSHGGDSHGGDSHGGDSHGGGGVGGRGDGDDSGGPSAGGGHGPGGGQPGPDGRRPGRKARALFEFGHGGPRQKAYVLGAGALAILLVVGGVVVWALWPGYRALNYQPLSLVRQVPAMAAVTSSFADAEVIGKRVYFASSDSKSGQIGVVAIDADATKPAWSGREAGTADRWESMTALPDGVALLSASDATGNRRVAVLDAKTGRLRWQRVLDTNDDLYFVGDLAVLADATRHQLSGLRLDNGSTNWTLADLKTTSGTSTSIFVATTAADLDGPATVGGRPLDPDVAGDNTIVQVSSDRSARVIDARTGKVRAVAQGVADTNDEVVAHDGRLIVRQSEGIQRIVSYPLDKLGEPKSLYTPKSDNNHLTHLTPCGDRICFVEDAGYDTKTDVVTAVDLDKGGQVWHHPLADVAGLVPVGSNLLVTTSVTTTLLDGAGTEVWSNGGATARLDAGNLIEFAKPLSSIADDPSVAGQHLGDQPVQLGPLNDVQSDTCSWNTSVIACVGYDQDVFKILRFAK
jgi:molecular chaperone HscA